MGREGGRGRTGRLSKRPWSSKIEGKLSPPVPRFRNFFQKTSHPNSSSVSTFPTEQLCGQLCGQPVILQAINSLLNGALSDNLSRRHLHQTKGWDNLQPFFLPEIPAPRGLAICATGGYHPKRTDRPFLCEIRLHSPLGLWLSADSGP